jgi:diguanylate cyclase (GGDEF)-like protein
MIAATLLFLIYYNSTIQYVITLWIAIYFVFYLVRYAVIKNYINTSRNLQDPKFIIWFYYSSSVIVGLLWSGAGIYILGSLNYFENIYFLMLLGGLVSGAVATNIILLSVYFSFIIPATLPVILFLLMQPTEQLKISGFIILLFVSFISLIANRLHKIISESLSYQFDNLQLLDDLKQEKNRVTQLYSSLEFDLAQRKKAEEQLKDEKERAEELAKTLMAISNLDGLTGIPNRRNFDSTLANEWNRASRSGTPISLIMCDIDNFKYYNDHYGHQKGDSCLIQVAITLQSHARRDNDLAARYGGEEFGIILPITDLENAKDLANQMLVAVRDLNIIHRFSDVDNIVTASFGVATLIPQKEQQSKTLLSRADKALYKAKQQGRNQIAVSQVELISNDEDINKKLA